MQRFKLHAVDATTRARRGTLATAHGEIETPAFMPVGTRASVTNLTAAEVAAAGAQVVLGNTYHLMLRPGPELLERAGGLHRFMGWSGAVLTDSGGYQIFSLADQCAVDEDGATFRSYVDCRRHRLTPERAIAVQGSIGSDLMMVLDVCTPAGAPHEKMREDLGRTHRWALRALAAPRREGQALLAIVQGGTDPASRRESVETLGAHPFDGFAIGGLAVGEARAEREAITQLVADLLPRDRPRYLMGVGTPADILVAIGQGVDLFDCVLPTSMSFRGVAFTSTGRVRLGRAAYATSDEPLDARCACPTCRTHPRGYLHHLIKARETLGPRLVSQHNLHHYLGLMAEARAAIEEGRYAALARARLDELDRHEHAEP